MISASRHSAKRFITIARARLTSAVETLKIRDAKRLYVDCGIIALVCLLLLAVDQGYVQRRRSIAKGDYIAAEHRSPRPAVEATGPASLVLVGYRDPAPSPEPFVTATPIAPVSFRPLNFSLLRGGFNSVDEFFERVGEDPALHSFYGDCSDRHASMHPLAADVLVFSAFRRGDVIKWAKRPLLVHKGEYVMTYCGKTVLARCGNLVSMAAMQPSEDVPPVLLETPEDAIAPPVGYGSSPVAEFASPAAAALVPTPIPAVIPAAVTPVAAHAGHFFFFVPPVYVPPGHSHSGPPTGGTPLPPGTPPSASQPPPSGPPSAPPPLGPPGPPTHVSGDEFSDHGAAFTLLFGLLVIGVLKLLQR
jgi:hypothetical protein